MLSRRSATRTRRRPRPRRSRTASARTAPPRSTWARPAPASATRLANADALIRSGAAEHVLVIGVEKLTDFVDPTDRGTSFIFADGAGAVVVGPAEAPGIGPVVWGSDGGQRDAITMTQPWNEYREAPVRRGRH